MKNSLILFFLILLFGCKPHATKQEDFISKATPSDTLKDADVQEEETITCSTQGELIDSVEQNNTLFQHFRNVDKVLLWLKVTTKDGKCTAFQLENDSNRSCNTYSFEDWDKDGFKDQIYNHCFSDGQGYQVALFDKTKNDFSRKIDYEFNEVQGYFDKTRNLEWQYVRRKWGSSYELYRIVDTTATVFSTIDFKSHSYELDNELTSIGYQDKNGKWINVKVEGNPLYAETKQKEDEDFAVYSERAENAILAFWQKYVLK